MENIDIEEEIVIDHEIINMVNMANPEGKTYTIRPHLDNLNLWDDDEFIRRFLVSKITVLNIMEEIEQSLRHRTNRNNAVPPLQKLLLTLRFFATSSFYITIADFGGIHKSTVGKMVQRVVYALAKIRENYIHLPENHQEQESIAVKFYRIARFPRIIGAIDCTHIKLQSPGGNIAENFRNRKGFFSLNAQVVCNSENQVTDIVARWPGASHDSYIFNNSAINIT